jgi:hypothetical protein
MHILIEIIDIHRHKLNHHLLLIKNFRFPFDYLIEMLCKMNYLIAILRYFEI